MHKIKKNSNILDILYNRELHMVSCPYKLSLSAISRLVLSRENTFVKVREFSTRNNINYEFGRIYCNNYKMCYTPYNCKVRYRLEPTNAKKKVCDAELFNGPIYNSDPCVCRAACTCKVGFIVTLSEDDWLCVHNIYNGKLLKQVYVNYVEDSPTSFKYCSWNTFGEDIVLQSKLNPKKDCNNVVAVIAVFNVLPLRFRALLEIERSVFGRNCNHVNLSENLLILGMNSYTKGESVHLYSFLDVLEEGLMYEADLGEPCAALDDGIVGCFPTGLPLNCRLESAPPLLFKVKCAEQTIHFGGFPWQYIVSPTSELPFDYHVRSVANHKLAINGNLPAEYLIGFYESDASFHPDHSGRIVLQTSHSVEFFQVLNHDDERAEIRRFSSMTFKQSSDSDDDEPSTSTKHHRCNNRCLKDFSCKSILSTDYEDELDLFAILGFDPDDASAMGAVKLYDNFTGKELKHIPLNISLNEFNDYNLFVNLNVIVIIEKTTNYKNTCYIYKLKLH